MDLADDFTASTEKPPTREEALAAAAELERFIGRLIAGQAKPGDMPSRPPVVLISYARTLTPLQRELITAEKQVGELHGRLKQKHNLLELASNALKLSTELAKESDARNKRLRAALEFLRDNTQQIELLHAAQKALGDDDAQQEADNTITVDPTGDLFGGAAPVEYHGLDNEDQVFFYEHDFYVLSNFSAFRLQWKGIDFDTSEHAYHWEKFAGKDQLIARDVMSARSAHVAFKLAEHFKPHRRADWDEVKVPIMLDILRAKAEQHEYVRRKLLSTGDRELIEDSWRDDFWGWGPKKDGKNMLGKLWMQVRAELREKDAA